MSRSFAKNLHIGCWEFLKRKKKMCEFCKYLKYRLYYTLFQIILLQNFLLLCYSLHFALIDTAHFDPTLFALINLVNTLFEWTIWIFNFGRSIMEFQNSHLRKRKSNFAKKNNYRQFIADKKRELGKFSESKKRQISVLPD